MGSFNLGLILHHTLNHRHTLKYIKFPNPIFVYLCNVTGSCILLQCGSTTLLV